MAICKSCYSLPCRCEVTAPTAQQVEAQEMTALICDEVQRLRMLIQERGMNQDGAMSLVVSLCVNVCTVMTPPLTTAQYAAQAILQGTMQAVRQHAEEQARRN